VLNPLLSLHNAMVPVILVIAGLALIAGLATYFMSRGAGDATPTPTPGAALVGTAATARRAFRWLLTVTAAVGVLQGIIGLLLLTQGVHPKEGLHFVYGIIVAGAVPVAYVYSDQKDVRRDIIIMIIAAAAVIGAAIRALATGA
jgi:heme A synthase